MSSNVDHSKTPRKTRKQPSCIYMQQHLLQLPSTTFTTDGGYAHTTWYGSYDNNRNTGPESPNRLFVHTAYVSYPTTSKAGSNRQNRKKYEISHQYIYIYVNMSIHSSVNATHTWRTCRALAFITLAQFFAKIRPYIHQPHMANVPDRLYP